MFGHRHCHHLDDDDERHNSQATERLRESSRTDRERESLERVLVVPGSQQEVVVAADRDRHVAPRHLDSPLRHSRDTIHLYVILIRAGSHSGQVSQRQGFAPRSI